MSQLSRCTTRANGPPCRAQNALALPPVESGYAFVVFHGMVATTMDLLGLFVARPLGVPSVNVKRPFMSPRPLCLPLFPITNLSLGRPSTLPLRAMAVLRLRGLVFKREGSNVNCLLLVRTVLRWRLCRGCDCFGSQLFRHLPPLPATTFLRWKCFGSQLFRHPIHLIALVVALCLSVQDLVLASLPRVLSQVRPPLVACLII